MNPNEQKLEELKEAEAQIKAEIAQAKADIQIEKAETVKATPVNIDGGRGLKGNRDAEGNLMSRLAMDVSNQIISNEDLPEGQHEMEDGTIMADDEMEIESSMSIEEAIESLVMTSKGNYDSFRDRGVIGDAAEAAGMSRVDFVMSPEFQAAYGNKYDKVAQPLEIEIQKGPTPEDEEPNGEYKRMPTDPSDIERDRRMDTTSADLSAGDTDNEQGRNMPQILDFEQRPMGMTEDEGGTSSVNEKDDFWKTQEGYDKAIEMFGEKPAWVKEPTMVYNPVENKYDKIKEEDKEEFEDLGMSADIKRMFG